MHQYKISQSECRNTCIKMDQTLTTFQSPFNDGCGKKKIHRIHNLSA